MKKRQRKKLIDFGKYYYDPQTGKHYEKNDSEIPPLYKDKPLISKQTK